MSDDDAPPLTDDDAPSDEWSPAGGRPYTSVLSSKAQGRGRTASVAERAGRDVLALAIHEPEAMAGRLDECLFTDSVQQNAYRALASAASLHDAIEHADDQVARLLVELANSDPEIGVDQALVALVRARAQDALTELQAEAREAQAAGDDARLLSQAPVVMWLKSELELFADVGAGDHPPRQVTDAADRLVAWLLQRRGEAA